MESEAALVAVLYVALLKLPQLRTTSQHKFVSRMYELKTAPIIVIIIILKFSIIRCYPLSVNRSQLPTIPPAPYM